MYLVKFTVKGVVHFGTVNTYGDEAKECAAKGLMLVEDALYPASYALPKSALTDLPNDHKGYSNAEFEAYMDAEYKKAEATASAATGLVGKMLRVNVADGAAYYTVTKENKRTVKVEWRGFGGLDHYTDALLGWGGSFPKDRIERLVRAADGLRDLFSRKTA